MESKKLKILAIDDNQDNLITLKAVVTDVLPNVEVLTAVNGSKGLELARREDPDVILLDIIMPVMDGFEVCEKLKKDLQLRRIPVLFLTALRTNQQIRSKALDVGAEGFLSKPFDESDLIAQILSMAKIKAANVQQHNEKERLEMLVAERTHEIAQELLVRHKVEQELVLANQLNQQIINCAHEGIIVYGRDLKYQVWNPYMEKLTGLMAKDVIGRYPLELHPFLREVGVINSLEQSLKGHLSSSIEYCIKLSGDRQIWVSDINSPLKNNYGQIIGVIGIVKDITDRKKREEEILYISYHDLLTGLHNRRFLETERSRLDIEEQLPISIIIADINGLKIINDGFGYAEGDKVIAEVANFLKQFCRKNDILARVGGDDFCFILPQTSSETVRKICERIPLAWQEYKNRTEREKFYPSITLGYATKTNMNTPYSAVVKEASEFMNRRKLLDSKSMFSSLITSIKTTMAEKDFETEEHAERMVVLSKQLGQVLNLTEEQLNKLELFATLHDIGKISVDDHILNKTGPLTEDEWMVMKKHPDVGYRIAMASPELMPIADNILSHHERWDGKGYPLKLRGEQIPLLSRILSVVDAYDAMTQDRPYRKAMPKHKAIDELTNNIGTQFDPDITQVFIEKVLIEYLN